MKDALAEISRKQRIEIEFDTTSLNDIGCPLDTPVSVSIRSGPFDTSLRRLLRPLTITYVPVGEPDAWRLLITTRECADQRLEIVVYPVGDLISTPEGRTGYDSLLQLLTSTVRPTSWAEVGGPGSIQPLEASSSLSISQTWEIHVSIRNSLADLRRNRQAAPPPKPPTPAGHPTYSRLAARQEPFIISGGVDPLQAFLYARERLGRPTKARWEFRNVALQEALKKIAASEGIEFTPLSRDIDPNVRVSATIEPQPLSAALGRFLESAGLDFMPLSPDAKRLQVYVLTKKSAAQAFNVVTYPVEDLLMAPGPESGNIQALMERIQRDVEPATWQARGGIGSIKQLGGIPILMVGQNWRVQAKLCDYLTDWRNKLKTSRPAEETEPASLSWLAPAVLPADRRKELDQLVQDVRQGIAAGGDTTPLGRRLMQFIHRHPATPEALLAAKGLPKLTWPLDRLRTEKIPADQLGWARGSTGSLPPGLVGLFVGRPSPPKRSGSMIAVGPEGDRLAAMQGGNVAIWNLVSGQEEEPMVGTTQWLEFSPQGDSLACAQDNGDLVRNLVQGQDRHFGFMIGPTARIVFNWNGTVFASIRWDGTVVYRNLVSGQQTLSPETSTFSLAPLASGQATAMSPDRRCLATAASPKGVHLVRHARRQFSGRHCRAHGGRDGRRLQSRRADAGRGRRRRPGETLEFDLERRHGDHGSDKPCHLHGLPPGRSANRRVARRRRDFPLGCVHLQTGAAHGRRAPGGQG